MTLRESWRVRAAIPSRSGRATFYPEKMKPEEMLALYSARLPTVEINNTFYQMPKAAVLENWAKTTPENFKFAIKASRRITHMSRLKADTAADSVNFLYTTLAALGDEARSGAVSAAAVPEEGSAAPESNFCTCCPTDTAPRSNFATTAGSTTMSTSAESSRRFTVPLRARRQRAAAAGGNGAVGLRPATARNVFRRRSASSGPRDLARPHGARSYVYFMHEPTAPAYAQTLMRFASS